MKNTVSKEEIMFLIIQGENILEKGVLEKAKRKRDSIIRLLDYKQIEILENGVTDADFLLKIVLENNDSTNSKRDKRTSYLIKKATQGKTTQSSKELKPTSHVRQMNEEEIFLSRMDYFLKNGWRFSKKSYDFLMSIHDLYYSEKRLSQKQKESYIETVNKTMYSDYTR